jgi:hypothetical protein
LWPHVQINGIIGRWKIQPKFMCLGCFNLNRQTMKDPNWRLAWLYKNISLLEAKFTVSELEYEFCLIKQCNKTKYIIQYLQNGQLVFDSNCAETAEQFFYFLLLFSSV